MSRKITVDGLARHAGREVISPPGAGNVWRVAAVALTTARD